MEMSGSNEILDAEARSMQTLVATIRDNKGYIVGGVLVNPYTGQGFTESLEKIKEDAKEGKIDNFVNDGTAAFSLSGTDFELRGFTKSTTRNRQTYEPREIKERECRPRTA